MNTIEKQLNVWSIQEQLSGEMLRQKQLDINLKVLRDQYIDQLIKEKVVVFQIESSIELKKVKTKRNCILL
ncbi:hypothetical protein IIV25_011R [Invertebrate iridovirus 25]|uniref:Uncharacterized protein n=1 Tax=Invertebrate iridovirus 25 TaxID=1301280 RepID=W8W2S1_9VIRU|nr:hypothetical protein IIV25_011R [Invertebrate iridovirus 25]CCV02029.1 hypothetical protein IIV25_011R [Invertebrate iridovirus 25]